MGLIGQLLSIVQRWSSQQLRSRGLNPKYTHKLTRRTGCAQKIRQQARVVITCVARPILNST